MEAISATALELGRGRSTNTSNRALICHNSTPLYSSKDITFYGLHKETGSLGSEYRRKQLILMAVLRRCNAPPLPTARRTAPRWPLRHSAPSSLVAAASSPGRGRSL